MYIVLYLTPGKLNLSIVFCKKMQDYTRKVLVYPAGKTCINIHNYKFQHHCFFSLILTIFPLTDNCRILLRKLDKRL